MAVSIKDPETDRLARALAEAIGESITEAIRTALAERLERTRAVQYAPLRASLQRIQERLATLPPALLELWTGWSGWHNRNSHDQ
jgi:antitoxin VapB